MKKSTVKGISDLLLLYYETMTKYPNFPKLILKVMALNHSEFIRRCVK